MRLARARRSAAERFAAAMHALAAHVPLPVAPDLIGFLLINTVTFAIDLALLSALHGVARWPLPAAISVAYGTAFALNFALNRGLNFRVHGALGPQLGRYLVVVALNYLLWILGLADLLAQTGLDYRVARVAAGACEAAYMYAALRWVVFRPRADAAAAHGSIEG